MSPLVRPKIKNAEVWRFNCEVARFYEKFVKFAKYKSRHYAILIIEIGGLEV